jgi:hypothetical protein
MIKLKILFIFYWEKNITNKIAVIITSQFVFILKKELTNIMYMAISGFQKNVFASIAPFCIYVQFKTRNFGHQCEYTVKKCKIGFTLLTSILPFATILIDMRLT